MATMKRNGVSCRRDLSNTADLKDSGTVTSAMDTSAILVYQMTCDCAVVVRLCDVTREEAIDGCLRAKITQHAVQLDESLRRSRGWRPASPLSTATDHGAIQQGGLSIR